MARKLHKDHPEATDPTHVASVLIKSSHHTHYVIGSGANDPQKYDPTASRETLDHSIPYIFTVALQDGSWHHVDSYSPERAGRPDTVELWHKVSTEEDAEWTRRYHSLDIAEKAFGGTVVITLKDGTVIEESIAVADTLVGVQIEPPNLAAGELDQLNITAAPGVVDLANAPKGLF